MLITSGPKLSSGLKTPLVFVSFMAPLDGIIRQIVIAYNINILDLYFPVLSYLNQQVFKIFLRLIRFFAYFNFRI